MITTERYNGYMVFPENFKGKYQDGVVNLRETILRENNPIDNEIVKNLNTECAKTSAEGAEPGRRVISLHSIHHFKIKIS
jgi:hypothetical protein